MRETIRRAFAEFLTVPTLIIAGFLLLAAGSYALDHLEVSSAGPVRAFLREHVFRNAKATGDLLGTVASGIITVTSITFSMLLLAVQQSAASLTNHVFDQYLRRRINQAFFGYFVGLALYALIILATVDEPYNPVYGATFALLLTVVALFLLIVLLDSTIDQMRPAVIIEAIHDHTLRARERHQVFLRDVRPSPRADRPVRALIRSAEHGYVVRIDVDAIAGAVEKVPGGPEVVLLVSVGSFVGYQDPVAEVRSGATGDTEAFERPVRDAIHLEFQRDLDRDPAFGIEQLHTIAWTSISTSKSNPYPGLLVIRSLRDLLARWSAAGIPSDEDEDARPPDGTAPVVYSDDLPGQLMDAFESLAIVSSESMQHLTMAEILRTFVALFDRLPPALRRRTEDLVLRVVSSLGDHVLGAELDSALSALVRTLDGAGRSDTAAAVELARQELATSIGRLNSRSTRVRRGG
ncbi:MAG: DUF2254 family protein [Singulisphaera sp.]